MERGLRPALLFGAAAFAVLLAFFLLRKPAEFRSPAASPKTGGRETTAAGPAKTVPEKAPSAPRRQGTDSLGVPLDPEAIARGVAAKIREHGEILARLKGQVSDQERVDLDRRASDLAGEVGLWTSTLLLHKAYGHKDAFAAVFRNNSTFKDEAAQYLANLPGDAGLDVLLEGLRGSDIYARSAAGVALETPLMQRTELSKDVRVAFRKVLSDDLGAVQSDQAFYGSSSATARDMAVKLRGIALRLLTRAQDVDSIPYLLDVAVQKDGVGWIMPEQEDIYALYRFLGKHPPPQLAERLTAVVDACLTAEVKPGAEPPGDAISASMLLAALGHGAKLQEVRERTYHDFIAAVERGEDSGIEMADSLLMLRDPRGADWLLDRLTSSKDTVRNRAVGVLSEAAGLKVVSPRDLDGEGSAQDRARWEQARQKWAEWWTAHRQEFSQKNPYAPR
jgi:hypothetical protein